MHLFIHFSVLCNDNDFFCPHLATAQLTKRFCCYIIYMQKQYHEKDDKKYVAHSVFLRFFL